MHKHALAVYNPSDPLEKAIQNAFHKYNDGWLNAPDCQLIAKAIAALKMFNDDWLNHSRLLDHRMDYFFAPFMSNIKDELVFVTHLLFVRDITENREINSYVHNPVVFVAKPIAHYLLRDYPIHMHFSCSQLKSNNTVKWLDIGGLLIADKQDVLIHDALLHIKTTANMASETASINQETYTNSKVAASLIAPGVFAPDQHSRQIKPSDKVWDKQERQEGIILKVEPGEQGVVEVLVGGYMKKVVPQEHFDREFVTL